MICLTNLPHNSIKLFHIAPPNPFPPFSPSPIIKNRFHGTIPAYWHWGEFFLWCNVVSTSISLSFKKPLCCYQEIIFFSFHIETFGVLRVIRSYYWSSTNNVGYCQCFFCINVVMFLFIQKGKINQLLD